MTRNLSAKDIMNPEVIKVREEMPVRELASLFTSQAISGAPVENSLGVLVGVVSVTDIVRATSEGGQEVVRTNEPNFYVRGWEEEVSLDELGELHLEEEGLLVKDIMTPSVFAVEHDAPIHHVAASMMESHLHRLLVVENDVVVGIISTSDMLQLLQEPDTRDLGEVALKTTTDLSFGDAVERCRESLGAAGFGVLTEIDIQATLKKKLNVDTEPYLILGACHPPSAYKALSAAPDVGVLLPCNVTVSVEEGKTVVRAMNPATALGVLKSDELKEVGAEVGAALQKVIDSVSG
ncbi:MAG: CBS domain-containing protein [Thermoanaerobaculia bacterium]